MSMELSDDLMGKEFCLEFCQWLSCETLLFGWKAHKENPGTFWHRNYVLSAEFNNHYDPNALKNPLSYQRLLSTDSPIAQVAKTVSTKFFNGLPLTRVWVNVQSFGDEAGIHHDFPPEYSGKSRTVVWYPVPEWDPEWGGDFAVFNKQREIVASTVIKPDRAAIFDGTMLHAARPMSRYCKGLRISVAFGREEI